MSDQPIADHALLSDSHSAALVDRRGSVEWLCFPRFDSPSVFGRLLDDGAGHFAIRPAGDATVARRYLQRSMVLETTFTGPTGTLRLTDALAVGEGNQGHDLGSGAPHLLVREAVCTAGEVDVEIDYVPRPEYGLIHPLLSPVDGGVDARGGADRLLLSCAVPLSVTDAGATGRTTLRAGEALAVGLQHQPSWGQRLQVWPSEDLRARLRETVAAWRSWSELHQAYQGPWEHLVHHSGRVLQALTYRHTGAIVAAATTSLPEAPGGSRNWDYRYAWVRDASLTLEALWVAACPDEAESFFAYLTGAAAGSVLRTSQLQIMFGIGGEHDLSERELAHLSGWRGSRPVRVGNGAWDQRQLDVYGELLNAAAVLQDQLAGLHPTTRRFLVALADAAAARWQEPDQGIWEVRGPPQHFLHSKLMCWVALDRAITLAGMLQAEERVPGWQRTRAQLFEAICDQGWDDRAGAFTQAFGSPTLDASALMIPIVGFLPGDDPRVLATIDAVDNHLRDPRGLIYRYVAEDGLEGREGTFLLCTFWFAQALALAGRLQEAREVFERAAGYVNDVGLLAEEVDPDTGELLGNFPQAFSHIGLVNAAWAIAEGERLAAGAGTGRDQRP